jgi:hypothetical protein
MNRIAEKTTPYQGLDRLLELTKTLREYGAQREDILYVIACYGAGIGLPGFDELKSVYRSRLNTSYV